jgi:hypothetical protein
MPAFLTGAALRLFLGGLIKKLGAWLSHRSFWQLVCMGLAVLLAVQTVRVKSEQRHSAKVEQQLKKATDELTRISSAKNTQKQTTGENIKVVVRTIHDAEGRAKVVETAPAAPNCKTNQSVLGADL